MADVIDPEGFEPLRRLFADRQREIALRLRFIPIECELIHVADAWASRPVRTSCPVAGACPRVGPCGTPKSRRWPKARGGKVERSDTLTGVYHGKTRG